MIEKPIPVDRGGGGGRRRLLGSGCVDRVLPRRAVAALEDDVGDGAGEGVGGEEPEQTELNKITDIVFEQYDQDLFIELGLVCCICTGLPWWSETTFC